MSRLSIRARLAIVFSIALVAVVSLLAGDLLDQLRCCVNPC